jgi:cell division septation protein DedD
MATKKQTSGTESTAAPRKTRTPKKTAAENAAPPAATDAATDAPQITTDAPKATAKKTAAKAQKPANELSTNGTSTAATTAPASASAPAVKVFGEVEASGKTFFIQKGSIEGQLQLVIDKGKKQLAERIPGYNGQFVTVLGEYGKQKKTDKFSTFVVHNLASHNEIAHRAFELSHDNPTTVEDNWFRAENELLNGK